MSCRVNVLQSVRQVCLLCFDGSRNVSSLSHCSLILSAEQIEEISDEDLLEKTIALGNALYRAEEARGRFCVYETYKIGLYWARMKNHYKQIREKGMLCFSVGGHPGCLFLLAFSFCRMDLEGFSLACSGRPHHQEEFDSTGQVSCLLRAVF